MSARPIDSIRAIQIAEAQCNGNSSALLCIDDAKRCRARGLHGYAIKRALASVEHSVGRRHPAAAALAELAELA